MGHSCGLYHNFHGGSSGSQCDDCDDNDPPGLPCPIQGSSNNIMDYWPGGRSALSQLQVGKMHYYLSGNAGTISDDIITECENNYVTVIPSGSNIF